MKNAVKNGANLIVSTAKASHSHSHSFGEVGSPKPPSPNLPSPGQNFVPKRQASPSLSVPPHQMPRRSLTATPPAPPSPFTLATHLPSAPSPLTHYWGRKSTPPARTTPDSTETKPAVRLPLFSLDTSEVDHLGRVKTEDEAMQTEASSGPEAKFTPKPTAAELELAAKHLAPRTLRLDGGLYFSAKNPDPLAKDFLAKRGIVIETDPATGSPILADKFAQGVDKYKLNSHNANISEASVRDFVEQSQVYHGARAGFKY